MIAAYDGANGTGNILWSWHVWVTDYQPDASGTETVLTPENKRKFKLGTSNTVMMDRNLGAYEGAVSIRVQRWRDHVPADSIIRKDVKIRSRVVIRQRRICRNRTFSL